MIDTKQLQNLGLTNNESLVYVALLELGETKTGEIVKKIHLHRVLIYDALESLITKGLASYVIKENIKYFRAAPPQRLLDILKEKESLARQLVPKLEELKKDEKDKQSVAIYEGIKGLKSAMNNMLTELTSKDDHDVFASGNMEPTLGPYYHLYQKEKKRKKIKTKVIYDQSAHPSKEIMNITFGDIRFASLGPFPTDTWIYKDNVLIVNYTASTPFAVLITNKETANSYKKIFEANWKNAKK